MSDYCFDMMSRSIATSIRTPDSQQNEFFEKHFEADTGMWIQIYPYKHVLHEVAEHLIKTKGDKALEDSKYNVYVERKSKRK